MRKQKGCAAIDLLLSITIVFAAVAIAAAVMRAQVTARTTPFKAYFGIDLSPYAKLDVAPDQWLTEEQKILIRPVVAARLKQLCVPASSTSYAALHEEPSNDPAIVEHRLELLERQRSQEPSPMNCGKAGRAAETFGLVPPEAP